MSIKKWLDLEVIEDFSKAVSGLFIDRCQVMVYTEGGIGPYRNILITYTPGKSYDCRFKELEFEEVAEGSEMVVTRGEASVQRNAAISHVDRIKITHRRHKRVSNPQIYEIHDMRLEMGKIELDLRLVRD